jgi:hypothetical protein
MMRSRRCGCRKSTRVRTLEVDARYWRDLTINTMMPAPSDETSEDGDYIFSYGPLKSGQKLTAKFDGQINPPLFAGTKGHLGHTGTARQNQLYQKRWQ